MKTYEKRRVYCPGASRGATVGSNTYLVSYEGGTGNDLTLTVQ